MVCMRGLQAERGSTGWHQAACCFLFCGLNRLPPTPGAVHAPAVYISTDLRFANADPHLTALIRDFTVRNGLQI